MVKYLIPLPPFRPWMIIAMLSEISTATAPQYMKAKLSSGEAKNLSLKVVLFESSLPLRDDILSLMGGIVTDITMNFV